MINVGSMKRARVLRKVLAYLTVLSTLFFRYFTLICAVMITCVEYLDLKILQLRRSSVHGGNVCNSSWGYRQ